MNARRLLAIIRKEFIHIRRDRLSLAASILIPVVLLVLFGWALNLDVDRLETVVCDFDRTEASRELLARLGASRFFTVVARVDTLAEAEARILDGSAAVALSVPAGFDRDLAADRSPALGVAVDGSDSTRASLGLGYAQALAQVFSAERLADRMRSAGLTRPASPIRLEQRVWFNPELESKNSIVPGLIAVIMTVIAALLTSLTIAREWERGTMEQLISTPLRRQELILGKLIPYILLGYVDVVLSVLMGILVFDVPFRGSYALLFAATTAFLVGAMSLGLLISIIGKTQLVANQMSMLIAFLPAFLLSGFTFAIENMPLVLQYLSNLFPATYFVHVVKAIFLKGVGAHVLWYDLTLLCLYAAALFALANARFRKRLD